MLTRTPSRYHLDSLHYNILPISDLPGVLHAVLPNGGRPLGH